MKHIYLSLAISTVALILTGNLQAGTPTVKNPALYKPMPNNNINSLAFQKTCPDPSAKIAITNIHKQSDGTFVFTLTGYVANVGSGDYISRNGQQFAVLSEERLGAGSRKLRQLNFVNMSRGAQMSTSYLVKHVSLSTEFLPGYQMAIQYGPDIYSDGNVRNDDCNRSNNMASISGEQIRTRLVAMNNAMPRINKPTKYQVKSFAKPHTIQTH
jgi:hypothetical protein